jgi:hypothetical protein
MTGAAADPKKRVVAQVTPRGLEITIATPGAMAGVLSALLIIFLVVGMFAFFIFHEMAVTGEEPLWLELVDLLFGRIWSLLAVVLLIVLLLFDRYSNEHYIFGRETLERHFRIGRIILNDDDRPLKRIVEPRAEEIDSRSGGYGVTWRVNDRLPFRDEMVRGYPISKREAEAVVEKISAWLAAPGELPVETIPEESPLAALAERTVSIIASRLILAIPLLMGVAGLLVLSAIWRHYDWKQAAAGLAPGYDRVVAGELVSYRWVVDGHDRYSAKVRPYLVLSYVPDDGQQRRLTLTTQRSYELYELSGNVITAFSDLIGVPHVEFELPARAALVGGTRAREEAWPPVDPQDDQEWIDDRFSGILRELDRPLDWLYAWWRAPEPDWRVAYSSSAPERAMPLRWQEAERLTLASISPSAFVIVGGVALLAIFATLPRIVARSRRRRWIGRLVVVAVVIATPWWSPLAERLPSALGVSERLIDGIADLIRLHASDYESDYALMVRAPARSDRKEAVLLRWTPEGSAAREALATLGLMPGVQMPGASFDEAIEQVVERAGRRLDRMSDEALLAFTRRYRAAEPPFQGGYLLDGVILPSICSSARHQTRDPETRQLIMRIASCE